MGLAVYNCITLDLRFPLVLYRKLLSTPVSGLMKQNPSNSQSNPVGVVPVSLDDLKDVDPVRFSNCFKMSILIFGRLLRIP